MFYAKPYGEYQISDTEAIANVKAIYDYLTPEGYSKNNIIGILGNIGEECGYNPWLWEDNTYNPSAKGYGLFQFTPGSEYLNASWIPDWAPNESTSQITPGADPNDAKGQLYAVINDTFGKWVNNCWRSYWDPADYPYLYNLHTHILSTYGSGTTISMSQFKTIDNIEDALFCFMACYEGPGDYDNPLDGNFTRRMNHAQDCKAILDNYSGMNILFMKKFIIDRQFGIL